MQVDKMAKGPSIIACSTCRFSAEARDAADGQRGGLRLYEELKRAQASDPDYAAIAIRKLACLFACSDHCTVHIQQDDKFAYVLGKFTPDEQSAHALLEYTRRYGESRDGTVAYSQWPEGVKGHFITRTPPVGFVEE